MKNIYLLLTSLLLPGFALAQFQPDQGLTGFLDTIQELLGMLVPILIGVAVIILIYGVIQWMMKGDDAEGRKDAGKKIIVGIAGLFIIISIWGLVSLLQNITGVDDSDVGPLPELIPGQ